jgi:hypothetical protein
MIQFKNRQRIPIAFLQTHPTSKSTKKIFNIITKMVMQIKIAGLQLLDTAESMYFPHFITLAHATSIVRIILLSAPTLCS